MRTFTVSFFGHRQIEAPFQVESQLEKLISQLLQQNEFVEFLVGREGEFDQLVSSTIRRCKRNIRDDSLACRDFSIHKIKMESWGFIRP